jgi:hypothetical protein
MGKNVDCCRGSVRVWSMTRLHPLKTGLHLRVSGSSMLFKIITLFLVFMAVLAMFGKWKFPGQAKLAAAKCRSCGRFRIGKGPCACTKGRY